MFSQKNNFSIGLVLSALGIAILGVDRLKASADSSTGFGQSMTVYTIVSLVILVSAAIWFFISSNKYKNDNK